MAAAGAQPFAGIQPPLVRRGLSPFIGKFRPIRKSTTLTRRCSLSTAQQTSTPASSPAPAPINSSEGEKNTENNHQGPKYSMELNGSRPGLDEDGDDGVSEGLNDFFEQAAVMVKSTSGGGPQWFSPVECGAPRFNGAPLLLYLPGVDGVGLGLIRQHRKLGKIFEVRCLHIPVTDRTPFAELVKLVEGHVRSEYNRFPKRPIYLVGESLGGCLALAVAARNPDIDLVLILANPATSYTKSPLQLLASLLESVPIQPFLSVPYQLSQMSGNSLMLFVDGVEKGLGQSQAAEGLLQGLRSLSSYYSVIADILPVDTLLWKMKILKDACAHANSRLHAIKAQTLILSSGRDPLLPSEEEGERLRHVLPKCEIRKFNDNGHFIFLEDGVDLVYTLKGASFYRRGRRHDYVADYLPPTPSEFKRVEDEYWWFDPATSPVMFSTLENGKIVRGLEGIPSEGPTLLVGYHMLMGFELVPLVLQILREKKILVRGMAHPLMFYKTRGGKFPDLSAYDTFRRMGAVPVSGTNLFKLLASKSHVLLYPGGMREALHRKGEEYQLFWPEQSEFVRMAARFGAKIVPFGVVGEDDIGQLVLDYNDLVRIPYFKAEIAELEKEAVRLRTDSSGEVSNQQPHLPGILPKVPGRFYYLFGKPIETKGRMRELKDRQKAHELYLDVKSEVEKCLAYLKEKREGDPYRSILSRLTYLSTHGFDSKIPTFEL